MTHAQFSPEGLISALGNCKVKAVSSSYIKQITAALGSAKPRWSFVVRHKDGPAIMNGYQICWFKSAQTRADAERLVLAAAANASQIPINELKISGSAENYAATQAEEKQT